MILVGTLVVPLIGTGTVLLQLFENRPPRNSENGRATDTPFGGKDILRPVQSCYGMMAATLTVLPEIAIALLLLTSVASTVALLLIIVLPVAIIDATNVGGIITNLAP